MKDYYKILELDESATLEDIKKSYKKLIRKNHPDLNPDHLQEAEEKTKELNEAYSILKDENKRKEYNLSRKVGDSFNPFSSERFSNFEDFFSGFNVNFGNRPKESASQQGSNITVGISISLKECIKGTKKDIRYKRLKACLECKGKGSNSDKKIACPDCKGLGYITKDEYTPFGLNRTSYDCSTCHGTGKVFKEPCKYCKGEGVLTEDEELSISIPKGAVSGITLRVPEMGNFGRLGGKPGHLFIQVNLDIPNSLFKVEDRDIYLEYPISMIQAILGDKVFVPSFEEDSNLEVVIPEGINNGSLLRIQGKGLPYLDSDDRGDYILVIKVLTPKNLSEEQKEILRRFNNEGEELK